MCYNDPGMVFKKQLCRKSAITFVEIMLAFIILAMVLIPIFTFLTGAVKDTEKFYTETIAISRAKFIMDTMMFQVPWRCIRQKENFCLFKDPENADGVNGFLQKVVPRMFGEETDYTGADTYKGDGIYTCRKGFKYRARAKVVDLDYDSTSANPIQFKIDIPGKDMDPLQINELVAKDADDKYNLIKKIIVQVKWSNHKGKDPKDDDYARSIFLVGFKAKLGS
ncbi:MAG: hypothetical protein ACQETH_03710 [Candidatus Rifleibacteriota bacterium]